MGWEEGAKAKLLELFDVAIKDPNNTDNINLWRQLIRYKKIIETSIGNRFSLKIIYFDLQNLSGATGVEHGGEVFLGIQAKLFEWLRLQEKELKSLEIQQLLLEIVLIDVFLEKARKSVDKNLDSINVLYLLRRKIVVHPFEDHTNSIINFLQNLAFLKVDIRLLPAAKELQLIEDAVRTTVCSSAFLSDAGRLYIECVLPVVDWVAAAWRNTLLKLNIHKQNSSVNDLEKADGEVSVFSSKYHVRMHERRKKLSRQCSHITSQEHSKFLQWQCFLNNLYDYCLVSPFILKDFLLKLSKSLSDSRFDLIQAEISDSINALEQKIKSSPSIPEKKSLSL